MPRESKVLPENLDVQDAMDPKEIQGLLACKERQDHKDHPEGKVLLDPKETEGIWEPLADGGERACRVHLAVLDAEDPLDPLAAKDKRGLLDLLANLAPSVFQDELAHKDREDSKELKAAAVALELLVPLALLDPPDALDATD